jgi:hypothetical protein
MELQMNLKDFFAYMINLRRLVEMCIRLEEIEDPDAHMEHQNEIVALARLLKGKS